MNPTREFRMNTELVESETIAAAQTSLTAEFGKSSFFPFSFPIFVGRGVIKLPES